MSLHMSLVDRIGPGSEISPSDVFIERTAGSVAENSVFPTGISVSGLEILPDEHFSPVTGMTAG